MKTITNKELALAYHRVALANSTAGDCHGFRMLRVRIAKCPWNVHKYYLANHTLEGFKLLDKRKPLRLMLEMILQDGEAEATRFYRQASAERIEAKQTREVARMWTFIPSGGDSPQIEIESGSVDNTAKAAEDGAS